MDRIRTLIEHLKARELRERSQEVENRYKALLMEDLATSEEPDSEGHIWFYLDGEDDEPLYGPDGGLIHSIKREKRESISLDEDKAEEILKELGLLEKCQNTYTVVELDEDAILSLNFEGKIPDEKLKAMYGEPKVTYAFKVDRDKPE